MILFAFSEYHSLILQVWSCSVVLSTYIGNAVKKGDMIMKNKNVVELGSGCGLCGIYAHYHGGKVVATDQKPMVGGDFFLGSLSLSLSIVSHNVNRCH